ncbi:SRPBCC family protein [Noviherbaspirillum sp.]|uniref:SRPBCC family protein n=1 Tax=Noviherbaspirillum sp. TaxID=1926288 RepID=UPI002D36B9A4|nr:SRPBCC family protein [Noviherbaspirillum sp.]HZW19924.1 SRPBCC family protein [Noviherbaspirillum sp.]
MEYRLLTLWRFAAPHRPVFDAVFDSLQWPAWWPGAEQVEHLAEGDADGIGALRRYVWKGRLPYRLSFVARTTQIETPRVLAAEVDGDLAGTGRWTFSHDGGITTVRYEWRVRTTRMWMNALAPLTSGIFARNHHATMQQGGECLARRLGARLVDAFYGELP